MTDFICPRCRKQKKKRVKMHEGAVYITCPKCGLSLRPSQLKETFA